MMRFKALCLSAIMISLCVCPARAAEIDVKTAHLASSTPSIPETTTIRLTGLFRQGDSAALRLLLMRLRAEVASLPNLPWVRVELSSLGGDLNEGLEVGYLFVQFDVATVVRKGDICLSTCALAFLGGTFAHGPAARRPDHILEIGGRLGFHSFWLNPGSAQRSTPADGVRARIQGFGEALAGAEAVMRYAADLNISSAFVARMIAKPPEEFLFVSTVEDFLTLDVCPADLGRPSISVIQQAVNVCNHSTGWVGAAGPLQVRAMTALEAMRYLLENVQQNMLASKVGGALSDQLASYSVMRDEKAVAALYDDLRAAGVRLPRIVGPVFEVAGYQTGEGAAQCFVSLSLEDPNLYEVAIRRPKTWAHPNWAAPRACHKLFLYDKDATINPPP